MAPRDTGERQELVGVQPIDGADVAGFGRLLDLKSGITEGRVDRIHC
jgi:hypothetical protein